MIPCWRDIIYLVKIQPFSRLQGFILSYSRSQAGELSIQPKIDSSWLYNTGNKWPKQRHQWYLSHRNYAESDKNGLHGIVWKYSHCTETLMPLFTVTTLSACLCWRECTVTKGNIFHLGGIYILSNKSDCVCIDDKWGHSSKQPSNHQRAYSICYRVTYKTDHRYTGPRL